MDLELAGKTALVTGASKGIGAAVATALAAEGANLRLVARNAGALADVAHASTQLGVDVDVRAMDLTEPGASERAINTFGDVDIVVNNAGAVPAGSLLELDETAWRAGWELKLFGYINLCRAVYARMKAQGHGVILNNIGTSGERTRADYIAGSSANAALMAFTRALGSRAMDDGVRVLGVNPGPVATERIVYLTRNAAEAQFGDEERYTELLAGYPLGRAAHPAEIADLITFLVSPRSSYVCGTIVTIDGGLSARS